MSKYIPDHRTKGVRFAAKQTRYNQELIHGIVNESPILHVSFNAPPRDGPLFPTILPMLGAIARYKDDEDPHVYLHGSSVARLFKLCGSETPVCVAATIIDGYVLTYAPFHNNCNYRCAILFGYGSVLVDPEEVNFALQLITNNANPDRWENSRKPPTKAELQSTAVLKVRIETASSKVRVGGTDDEKHDMQNPEVANKTWVGVVPTYLTLGSPIASEYNKVKQVPEYLLDWIADSNAMNEQKAVDAVEATQDE